MGNCVGRRSANHQRRQSRSDAVPFGKNVPLRRIHEQWQAESPLSREQLEARRREFWESSSQFSGKREVWLALRAAAEASDLSMSQAILDGGNITLPTGSLTDAYDDAGNRYQVPLFCLCDPVNLLSSGSESQALPPERSHEESGTSASSSSSPSNPSEKILRLRLSTNKDIQVAYRPTETIAIVKQRIAEREKVPSDRQRVFYCGKEVNDKTAIESIPLLADHVLQVLIRTA